jgi:hypothetical protein
MDKIAAQRLGRSALLVDFFAGLVVARPASCRENWKSYKSAPGLSIFPVASRCGR